MLHKFFVPFLSLALHVNLEFDVLDLVDMRVELEGGNDQRSLEFSTLSFLVIVVSALDEGILLSI